ncbi:putative FBD-associated F-box protein At5g56700 [Papaver somniferum]|uniref:putative FBD-associated F-box protein At5g56700 n=1 Tax=Papaver somniferum TaxID=3469 RepID=UPI000E70415C|nr:putative FBD-associated F-box protein At5g56700 [Papaver somniferum]
MAKFRYLSTIAMDTLTVSPLYVNGDNNGATIVADICKWITTAVSHNVQELTIKICIDEDFFEIPACLCTCKSLTKLEMVLGTLWADECKVILPCTMNLPRIKSLGLRFFHQLIGEEKLANKFFSGFPTQRSLDRDSRRLNKVNLKILSLPNLESLVTRDCGFDDLNLNISFPKLKYFALNDFKPNGEIENTGEYKLYAPSLASFVLKGYMPTSITLENLSSLVRADMRIWIKREDIGDGVFPEIRAEKKEYYTQLTLRFLRGFHNVKVLTLNGSFLKV